VDDVPLAELAAQLGPEVVVGVDRGLALFGLQLGLVLVGRGRLCRIEVGRVVRVGGFADVESRVDDRVGLGVGRGIQASRMLSRLASTSPSSSITWMALLSAFSSEDSSTLSTSSCSRSSVSDDCSAAGARSTSRRSSSVTVFTSIRMAIG
jgi:hypothetical protein